MMRCEREDSLPRKAATAMARPLTMRGPRIGLIGLAGMILVLLLGSGIGLAEPADAPDGTTPDVAVPSPAAMAFSVDRSGDAADTSDLPTDVSPSLDLPSAAGDPPLAALAELVFVRSYGAGLWKPRTTDEILAAAVAKGTTPDLEPLNPFRKRSRDLFRTERPVSIGNADMLLRLRLRAKARRAVSLELRF